MERVRMCVRKKREKKIVRCRERGKKMDTSTKADIWTQISFWTISSFDSTLRFPWQQPPLALPDGKLTQRV